ncbi:ferredoxin family protein [Sneathiella sp.]|jgi:NAD-dependent dihydropyrimidine dehydrogenase PreA subunit|uniref:4Fe-4S dicluster domain-containing protein n=1 Tax=Sneathiella sp. TaxID=1964365 RepID=UPI0039E45C88
MTYVITGPCVDVKDGECTNVCPVDCIYEGGRMFYIHPDECVACGLCESVCPVDAIRKIAFVEPEEEKFLVANAEYFSSAVTNLGQPGGWKEATTTTLDHPIIAKMPVQKGDGL